MPHQEDLASSFEAATAFDSEVYRDNGVLLISQFLTSFQSFYSVPLSDFFGPISPDDIANVMDYRKQLQNLEKLKQDFFIQREIENQLSGSGLWKNAKVDIQNLRELLNENDKNLKQFRLFNDRVCKLEILLQRFEVWSTKALAQHLLISHNHHDNKNYPCWCTLLNLPTSNYSKNFLPEVERSCPWDDISTEKRSSDNVSHEKHHQFAQAYDKVFNNRDLETHECCSLSIPPNVHTWREYLRILTMLAQLPNEVDRQQAHSSYFCFKPNKGKEHLQTKFEANAVDLVALWIRSQRNSQARRHLINLFQVTKIQSNKNGEPNRTTVPFIYAALYKGNHRYTQNRVQKESKLIDMLIDWAVTKQVLRRHPLLFRTLVRRSEQYRKRCLSSNNSMSESRKKRKKLDEDDTLTVDQKRILLRSCQVFLLRSFSLRNRKIVSILFYKDQKEYQEAKKLGLDSDSCFTEKLANNDVFDLIRCNFECSDRLLPRIDRRILIGKYDVVESNSFSNGSAIDLFYSSVHALLEALGISSEGHINEDERLMLKTTVEDFEKTYEQFTAERKRNGLVAAARMLLDESLTYAESCSLSQILSTFPPPWIERCSKCGNSAVQESSISKIRICSFCNSSMHVDCGASDEFSLPFNSMLKESTDLQNFFKIAVPKGIYIPDFRDSNKDHIEWGMKTVYINRKVENDGKLERYGLTIRQTEDCSLVLDQMLNGDLFVDAFSKTQIHPLSVSIQGSLVIGQMENCCAVKSGLMKGDVIISLKIIEFQKEEIVQNHSKDTLYKFSSLSKQGRMDLFRLSAQKLQVTVMRPNKDILAISSHFVDEVSKCNVFLNDVLTSNNNYWYCNKCVSIRKTQAPEDEENRILHRVELCKSIIFQLARDLEEHDFTDVVVSSYTVIDNDEIRENKLIFPITSLQDLAHQMDLIKCDSLSAEIKLEEDLKDRSDLKLLCHYQSHPYELLCSGIKYLAIKWTRNHTSAKWPSAASLMTRNFVRLFCSWGLAIEDAKSIPFCVSANTALTLCASKLSPFEDTQLSPKDDQIIPTISVVECDTSDIPATYPKDAKAHLHFTSLIGKILLVLPEDPLLLDTTLILQEERVHVEHLDRPVEFLIASYSPNVKDVPLLDSAESYVSGTFYLIPLVVQNQIQFLLNKCSLRKSDFHETYLNPDHDEICSLRGVAKVSSSELLRRLKETESILDAIDLEIRKTSQLSGKLLSNPDRDYDDDTNVLYSPIDLREQGYFDSTKADSTLIETMLVTSNPLLPAFSFESLTRNDVCVDNNSKTDEIDKRRTEIISCFVSVPREVVDGKCELLYTDFWFSSIDEQTIFEKSSCIAKPDSSEQLDIQLTRNSLDKLEWGFEILFWTTDQAVRIGRVQVDSPAWKAGLRSGGLLLSVNGLTLNKDIEKGNLACLILGLSDVMESHLSAIEAIKHIALNKSDFHFAKSWTGPILTIGKESGRIEDQLGTNGLMISDASHLVNPASHDYNYHASNVSGAHSLQIGLSPIVQVSPKPIGASTPNCLPMYGSASSSNLMFTVGTEENTVNTASLDALLVNDNGNAEPHSLQYNINVSQMANVPGPISTIQNTWPHMNLYEGTTVQTNSSAARRTGIFYACDPKISQSLQRILRIPRGYQVPLSGQHLYSVGLNGTLLTLAETSLLLESIHNCYPMLGLRMLCPRYSISTLIQQLSILASFDTFSNVPRLNSIHFSAIITLDYYRSFNEAKEWPVQFVDVIGEHQYSYKMPTNRFPIDRLLETKFNPRLNPALGSVDSPDMLDLVYYDTGRNVDNSSIDRLRGGGDTTGVTLRLIDETLWDRTLVYGDCRTTLANAKYGQAKLIGYIDSTASKSENDQAKSQPVKVFYLSNVGITADLILMEISARKLFLVELDSEERRCVDRWISLNKSVCLQEKKIPHIEYGSNGSCDYVLQIVEDRQKEDVEVLDVFDWNDEAQLIDMIHKLDSLADTGVLILQASFVKGSSDWENLGHLSDGRAILWYKSDPRSLYLCPVDLLNTCTASLQKAQHKKSQTSHNSTSNDNPLSSYHQRASDENQNVNDTMTNLWKVYCVLLESSRSRQLNMKLIRLREGNEIVKLVSSILLDWGAKETDFQSFIVVTGEGDQKKVQLSEPNILNYIRKNPVLSRSISVLLLLALKVRILFDNDGSFRLSNQLLKKMMRHKKVRGSDDDFQIPLTIPLHEHAPYDEFQTNCGICDIGTERALIRASDEGSSKYCGCSCAPVSIICFGHATDMCKAKGELGYVKNLLFNVVKRIPDKLRSSEDGAGNGFGIQNSIREEFWTDDDTMRQWIDFVNSACNLRLLCQAFIVLIASIQRDLLPTWWSDESTGWSNSSVLSGIQSISELALHLTTFDHALVEYAMLAAMTPVSVPDDYKQPDIVNDTSYAYRTMSILEFANDINVKRWDKNYDTYCTFCEDGGELVCCELCSALWHKNCCRPPLVEVPDTFVCESCMIDVSNLIERGGGNVT